MKQKAFTILANGEGNENKKIKISIVCLKIDSIVLKKQPILPDWLLEMFLNISLVISSFKYMQRY